MNLEEIINYMTYSMGDFFSPVVIIFVISMIPILELRGGLIAASLLNIDWKLAMIVCIIGNLIPIPFILLFIKKILAVLKRTKVSNLVNKIEQKADKSREKISNYKNFGLYLFVAIPFPGTGAWTGALVASLFDFKIKNAVISILLGILTAAVIMSVFSYGILGTI